MDPVVLHGLLQIPDHEQVTDVALAGNASPEARKLQDQIRGGQLRQIDTMNELRTQVKP